MNEKLYEINSISYAVRIIKESDLNSLLMVKNDVSVHTDRFQQQQDGKAVYLGAFINNYAIGYVLLSLENKEDVMLYTNNQKCADMIDLLIIEPLRNYGIGSRLALACEEITNVISNLECISTYILKNDMDKEQYADTEIL